MHVGLNTVTDAKRDLSIMRTGVSLKGRPVSGVQAPVQVLDEFAEGER